MPDPPVPAGQAAWPGHSTPARAALALGMSAALTAASVVTLGAPNLGLARQFLTGGYPSLAGAVALCSLICYACVALASVVVLAGAVRSGSRGWRRRQAVRAVTLIVTGAALLSLSLVGRVAATGDLCCGGGHQQIQEAASLAR